MKGIIMIIVFIVLLPASLSATYIIEHRTNGTSSSSGNGTTIINNYNNSINISGVTNQTQTLEFNLYPISAGYSGFPGWEHNETSGQHILKIGLLPNEVDTAGLLSSNDYNTFNNKVSSQWTSFGTTYPRGIYYQDSGINQVFMGDSFDISNTTQLNNFWTAISGPAVIYYDAGASKKPHTNAGYLGFGYPLSIQKAGVDAYLEIANWNGENQGVFFGNYDKNFELWSYAGGPIIFYTSPFASDGSERVRITSNGSLVTGGGGSPYDIWSAWDVISWKIKVRNELNATYVNTSNLCINGDCKTAWPLADNSSWNQTYANSIYYPYITNPLSYYNSSSPPTLDVIGNPTGSKTFTMANKNLSFVFTAPTDNAFEIEALGGFSGDLLHVHQHTGNPPAGTDLVHIESSDADVLPLNITTPAGRSVAIATTANITINGKQVLTTNNELGFYNSSTLPSSSGEPDVNITELDTLWWFSLFPSTSATTATNMGANTGRGCKFSVPDNMWWNRTYVRTGATNTTIGISAGIYSCSSAMCDTKTLIYNFTKQSLTSGNQVWVNTTGMWNLSAGTYWFVVALNTTGTTPQSVYSTGNNNINTGMNNNCGTFSTGGQASMPASFTTVTGTTAYIVPLTLYTG